ncbi:Deoxyhypusine hydroxylase [Podospora fimiseda]|uniref:Deoxyhypusine hydroxylase n=1 Tax=Podospora fimiseda TaxID=252190 RepID=A0AAN7BXR1_9PEZI|nr:Deoxyhypusine hydroxylase [Podospora fimiseda]
MGIPRLKRLLEPFADRKIIQPCKAVIDGPALAYHALTLCSRGTLKSSPFEQPSYEVLGRTAIDWLNQIEEYGVEVSQIYFDGFLPALKRPERTQRLAAMTKDLVKYHSLYPTKVPKERSLSLAESVPELFPTSWGGEAYTKPPIPPFLVPVVIDALRCSKYRPVTTIVGGEADGPCASFVRDSGGIVLTSDSDLLVHDLGENGAVVFFPDIEADVEAKNLISPQYQRSNICRKLSINPDTGLSYLSFEILNDRHLTVEQGAERSRRGDAITLTKHEYDRFLALYLSPETALNDSTSSCSSLDPRISELVFQLSNASLPENTETKLEMYLPFLLDSPSRTSAWESSKDIRCLAYHCLLSTRQTSLRCVSEMRRLQSTSSGVQFEVEHTSKLDEECAALLKTLARIKSNIQDSNLVWAVLTIYQDILMTVDRARGTPLSLDLLAHEVKGDLDHSSWDFLHLVAQAQATYYSLRMVKQLAGLAPQTELMAELIGTLSELPSLKDFPSIHNFSDTLRRVREQGGLKSLTALCADFDDILPRIESIGKPSPVESKKSNKRKAIQTAAEPQTRKRFTNPTIAQLRESLCAESTPLPVRFRALFSLKHLAKTNDLKSPESLASIDAIAAAFTSPSALLKHELAYCLGQTGNGAAIPYLTRVLEDLAEDPMCRHEAAEALGALGDAQSLEVLKQYRDREGEEVCVKETCEIAIDRIEWENSEQRKKEKLRQSDFASVDPAPPLAQGQEQPTVEELGKTLMDTTKPLFLRYRAMFALRDLASPPDLPTAVPAVHALAAGFADSSALFRHEIAFVFGQLSHPASIPALTAALSNTEEASMVRHEAAEALGSLGDEEGVEETLKKFLHDKEAVVRESCIVALDMAEYEKSNETEYALIPEVEGTA